MRYVQTRETPLVFINLIYPCEYAANKQLESVAFSQPTHRCIVKGVTRDVFPGDCSSVIESAKARVGILPGFPTSHDPTRGSVQQVFEVSRVQSDRVRSGRGRRFSKLPRTESEHPCPT